MKRIAIAVVFALALAAPASAEAHHGRHHHRGHHGHRHAHHARAASEDLALEIVSVEEVTETPDEQAADQVAVEAYEGNTFGEPPTTPQEEETPTAPEP